MTLLALAATAGGQWVEDSIDVGSLTTYNLAYNSCEDVVYGTASQSDRFFAIACSSNQLVASYGIPAPSDVVYDSTDNKAYCTYRQGYVAVIDGETHQWVRTIVLDWATRAVWDAVGDRLYVSCLDENEVAVIDCVTDSVTDRISVGRDPNRLCLGGQRRRLYVLNHDSESISIVDLDSHEVIETIRLGFVPGGGCYSAAVDKFYCGAGSDVVVVDGAGDSVLSVIELPMDMTVHSAVAVESESLVMVGTGSPTVVDTIYVLDAVADTLVAAHAVGGTAWALFWSATSGMVYAAVSGASGLEVVAEDGSRILASLAVGEFPFCFAYSPEGKRLYVGHLACDYVYVIRDSVTGILEPGLVRQPHRRLRAHPNPFWDKVEVELPCALAGVGRATVYSQDGRVVARLACAPRGGSLLLWDGTDQAGCPVPAGVYFLSLDGDPARSTRVVKLK